ncbi:MAG: hypothetical protein K5770_14930 [Lachnospiraceae bacterium]|nr:hypothetical protein [Lachnospiraceae bacterium]
MTKSVKSLSELKSTDPDPDKGITITLNGPTEVTGSLFSSSNTVWKKTSDNEYIFFTKEHSQWDEVTKEQNTKHYSQSIQLGYEGKYGTEELIVNDGDVHTINYTDTYIYTNTTKYTKDDYAENGKAVKNDERWIIFFSDNTTKEYTQDDFEAYLNDQKAEDLNAAAGEGIKKAINPEPVKADISKTRTVSNSSSIVSDGISLNLDSSNSARSTSVYLAENSANSHLLNADYKDKIGDICSFYLKGYNIYGSDVTAVNGKTDLSTLSVTARPVSVNYSATALKQGNRVHEPEYGRLISILPEKELILQAGDDAPNDITLAWHSMSLSGIGLSGTTMKSQESCKKGISQIQEALDLVSEERSIFGAHQNRLEHAIRINDNTSENLEHAESRIRDTDMSEETVRFAKEGILQQVGQSMLAQANQNRQGILSLLQ